MNKCVLISGVKSGVERCPHPCHRLAGDRVLHALSGDGETRVAEKRLEGRMERAPVGFRPKFAQLASLIQMDGYHQK